MATIRRGTSFFPTGSASTKPGPMRGVITNSPSGLFWSDASLARNLLYDTPAEAVSPVSALIFARIRSAIAVAEAIPARFSVTSRYASSSDSGSISGVYSAKIARMRRDSAL